RAGSGASRGGPPGTRAGLERRRGIERSGRLPRPRAAVRGDTGRTGRGSQARAALSGDAPAPGCSEPVVCGQPRTAGSADVGRLLPRPSLRTLLPARYRRASAPPRARGAVAYGDKLAYRAVQAQAV